MKKRARALDDFTPEPSSTERERVPADDGARLRPLFAAGDRVHALPPGFTDWCEATVIAAPRDPLALTYEISTANDSVFEVYENAIKPIGE